MTDSEATMDSAIVTPEAVEELAYELWERRNQKPGSALEDWLEAERLLRDKMGQAA